MDTNGVNGDEAKNFGRHSFLRFDRLYFPVIARPLFMILCAAVAVFGVIFVIIGIAGVFTIGMWHGLGVIAGAIVCTALAAFLLRMWFELVLVAFNMNDALQEIRVNTRK